MWWQEVTFDIDTGLPIVQIKINKWERAARNPVIGSLRDRLG